MEAEATCSFRSMERLFLVRLRGACGILARGEEGHGFTAASLQFCERAEISTSQR